MRLLTTILFLLLAIGIVSSCNFGGGGDPCRLTRLGNLREKKCTLACLAAGAFNGGFCDDNNQCQCNVPA